MLFTFKRDEEGRERIYMDNVCVWMCNGDMRTNTGRGWTNVADPVFDAKVMGDAIERADEAGFWAGFDENDPRFNRTIVGGVNEPFRVSEVTVDVFVPATSTSLSVTTPGDEA
jgi:hypothetical protein